MKERQSIKFAKWTKAREEWYKKECDKILYRTKSKIIIDNDEVFILTNNQKTFLLTIDNPKSTWFQIWLKLRDDK
ncbi:MAG: hypothetical protein ACRDE2_16530 [Chitinophagaceae bacterium]